MSCESLKRVYIKGYVGVKEVGMAERVVVVLETFELSDTCERERLVQREAVHTHEGVPDCDGPSRAHTQDRVLRRTATHIKITDLLESH